MKQIRIAALRACPRPASRASSLHKLPGKCNFTPSGATGARQLHYTHPRLAESSPQAPTIAPTDLPKDAVSAESEPVALESTDILEVYRSLVARGLLDWDEEQVRCVMQVSIPRLHHSEALASHSLQLRKLLEELQDYTPPLDLLAKLSPDAPLLAREAMKAEKEGKGASWWKGLTSNDKGDAQGNGPTERERALVKVLSGEEELEALTTPKVRSGSGIFGLCITR